MISSSELMRAWPGQLGLVVLDQAAQPLIAWNATTIFPSASVIKAPLAWQWLELADPTSDYTLQAADIVDPDGCFATRIGQPLPREALAREMIITSENNATNLVLEWVGGFAAANRWLDAYGLHQTRWARRMCDWAARAAGLENQTSAGDMAAFFHTLHQAVLQGDQAAATAVTWLQQCASEGKLDRGMPVGASLAHKTGSLPDGIEHDVGRVTLADGRWYAVAILSQIAEPEALHRARIAQLSQALIAEIDQ